MRSAWAFMAVLLGVPLSAEEEAWIGAPEEGVTRIDEEGIVLEDWGNFGIEMEKPTGTERVCQVVHMSPAPHVKTHWNAGDISLELDAFRAPVWPNGVDVLNARVARKPDTAQSDSPMDVTLTLRLPETLELGERMGVVSNRQVLLLPEEPSPIRVKRQWGCKGGVVAMPGWGRPSRDCDQAFRNISAGMGGVPIEYEFTVHACAQRTVFLGLCESHWDWPGRRPLVLSVEGANPVSVDPVALWGKHGAGCVRFDGWDSDGNGRLEVRVLPHPDATDKNTILNGIWFFPGNCSVEAEDVIRGHVRGEAEYYVDVGGESDQLLYEGGSVDFCLSLAPGESVDMPFLLAHQGVSLAGVSQEDWQLKDLNHAADRVCQGVLEIPSGIQLSSSLRDAWLRALLPPLALRRQADGFYVLPQDNQGGNRVSFRDLAHITSALDRVGYTLETERFLRVLTDVPVPDAFSSYGQQEDGMWDDGTASVCGHAWALLALANHGLLSRDAEWLERAWEPMKRGGDWLLQKGNVDPSECEDTVGLSLLALGQAASLLGDASSCDRYSNKGKAIAGGENGPPNWEKGPEGVLADVGWFHELADCLIKVEEREVQILPAFSSRYIAEGGLRLPRLCTEKGEIDLEVSSVLEGTRVVVQLGTGWEELDWIIFPPTGMDPIEKATVDGKQADLSSEGGIRLRKIPSLFEVVFYH